MILNISGLDVEEVVVHELPGGGRAVLDNDNKLVAYNKNGDPDGNDWSWVRSDFVN